MQITIHRGTREIGGSCIEVSTAKTRVILDLGMPLVAPWDKTAKLDSRRYGSMGAADLLKEGILPKVPGLYFDDAPPPDALILSHPHQDHYGLIRHLRPGIPVFLSDAARRIIEVSDIFLPIKASIREPRTVMPGVRFSVGDIQVDPYLMDHSALGALGLLLEGEGRRVFYSGDFRGHGRKRALFDRLIKRPPKRVDALLMEGTTLGRDSRVCESEQDLELSLVRLAKTYKGLKLIAPKLILLASDRR